MNFNKWENISIGDICQTISQTHKIKKGELIFLNTGDIERGKILHNKYSSVEKMPGQAKKSIRKGDILFSEIRPANGRWAYVDFEANDFIVSTKLMVIRANEKVNSKYLYHLLTNPEIVKWLQHLAESRSGTFPQITFTQVANIEIKLPPLPIQNNYASFFDALDDKIELNRQTNKTLETIAQTLFKEMCLPKGEELPEGWEVVKLAEIMKIKHGYAFKGEFFSDEETNDILVTPGNFKIGGGFNYSKFKYYKGEVPNDYILKENDLIVTMTDLSKEGDTLGYAALIPTIEGKKLLHNQRVGKVEFKENNSLKYFLYFVMRENNYRNFVLSGATGTTVRHTSPDRICDFTVTLPNQNILEDFSEIVHPVFDNIQLLEREIQTLSSLRDSLLPKLMKGEINV